MQENKRKKLNMAIKKQFQRWLLVRIAGTVMLAAGTAAVILYFYSRQELGASFYTAHITVRRVSDLLLPVILAGAGVSLLSGLLLALFLPQKIAGPLYHIENDLRLVGRGDLTVKIVLRQCDTLQDFAGVVNDAVGQLRHSVEEVQQGLRDLDQSGLSAAQREALQRLYEIRV
ncbi:MAG: chemotaxis protein [Desulfobulbaceae bacterium]|nr:MAG: chemotaxis protein [Desulfobulbaceae bacterium]